MSVALLILKFFYAIVLFVAERAKIYRPRSMNILRNCKDSREFFFFLFIEKVMLRLKILAREIFA